MDQKQKTLLIIPIFIFLSIVMTEMNLWNYIHNQSIWMVAKILAPVTNVVALYGCFRLTRVFDNAFFKLESVALILVLAVEGLGTVKTANTLCLSIGLTGTLLSLYALLQYREGWEQFTALSPMQRIYELVPVSKKNWFWLLLFGLPLGLYKFLLADLISPSLINIIHLVFAVIALSAQILGLTICFAMVKTYGNNFFKYLAAVYVIPLGIAVLSFFNAILVIYLSRSFGGSLPDYFSYGQITFNYIFAFHGVVVGGILVYAFFRYNESQKRECSMQTGP